MNANGRFNIYRSSAVMLSGLTQILKKLFFIVLINNEPTLTSTLAAGIVPGVFA